MSDVAILGVGMHPWGKWGRNFVEYGVAAARAALSDAGVAWRDVQFVAGGETIRNGYPGFVAGSAIASALGFNGADIGSAYGACASGTQAISLARAQILAGLCDVALVVGADTTPKGFFAPTGGGDDARQRDPDWLRFRLLGATNPVYFGLYARRRMELYGDTEQDFARVKVKNSQCGAQNPNARYPKAFSLEEVLASPMVSDPLRLLQICATSDGGAALVLASMEFARKHGAQKPVVVAGVSTVTPRFPNTHLEMPDFASDSSAAVPPPVLGFRESIAQRAYEQAGLGPEDMNLAEVYDLSSALELDWVEAIGLAAPGEAAALLRAGELGLGGRIPVNPSGGLGAFGEAIPAQAIAQVCELVWQIRGAARGRQVEGARAGVTANLGLFGHGSAVVVRAH